jgi:hypothetical protein
LQDEYALKTQAIKLSQRRQILAKKRLLAQKQLKR